MWTRLWAERSFKSVPSIHLLGCVCLGWGQGSRSSPWSDSVCVYVNASVTECGTAVACHALIKVHSTWGLCDVNWELITQLATAQMRPGERWLSVCVKSVCVCVQLCVCVFIYCVKRRERETWGLNATLTSVKVQCVFVCVHECAQNKRNNPQSHLAAMPHDEYTAKSVILTLITIPACSDVQLWQGECVWVCVCVSSKQRQHHLSGPVTVCVCAGCQGSRYTEMQTTAV